MDLVIEFFVRWMLGPVVAIFIGYLAHEPIRKWLASKAVTFGLKDSTGINTTWEATFYYGDTSTKYVEIIEIKTLFGQVVGNIVPHDNNHDEVKKIAEQRPLRLMGTLKDSRYFTGEWYHPNKKNHHHGAFKLLITLNQEKMDGIWIGYSEKNDVIESGKWSWQILK